MPKVNITRNTLERAAGQVLFLAPEIDRDEVLDRLSKTLLNRPWSEVRNDHLPVYVLARVGTDTILAKDGAFITSAIRDDGCEVTYRELAEDAKAMLSETGGEIRALDLPDYFAMHPLLTQTSNQELVDLMNRMGLFRPEGSIFYDLHRYNLAGRKDGSMMINGAVTSEVQYFESVVYKKPLEDAEVLTALREFRPGHLETVAVTFDRLCRASKFKPHVWILTLADGNDAEISFPQLKENAEAC